MPDTGGRFVSGEIEAHSVRGREEEAVARFFFRITEVNQLKGMIHEISLRRAVRNMSDVSGINMANVRFMTPRCQ